MDELFELLSTEEYFTQDIDMLEEKLEDLDYQEKVYEVLKRDGIFTDSFEDFQKRFLKKKRKKRGVKDIGPEGTTESELPVGSSEESEKTLQQTFNEEAQKDVQQRLIAQQNQWKEDYRIIMGEDLLEDKSQEEAQSEMSLKNVESFDNSLKLLNEDLIDKEEENVVPYLKSLFGEYDFVFEEATWLADAMNVYAPNGVDKIKIDLQPSKFFGGDRARELKKLKNFLALHATNEVKRNRKVTPKTRLKYKEASFGKEKMEFQNNLGTFQKEVDDFQAEVRRVNKMSAVERRDNQDLIKSLQEQQQELLATEKSFNLSEEELVQKANLLGNERNTLYVEEDTGVEKLFGKNFLTDFLGDMQREWNKGQAQGNSVDEALALMNLLGGEPPTDEQIQDFIIANERLQQHGESDEMKSFGKVYEEEGGGILGFIKGVIDSPSVIPQLFVSSVGAMATEAPLTAGGTIFGAIVGTGATVGAISGAPAGGVGAGPGAVGGATASLPYAIPAAIGALSTTLETGLTFAELLKEQLDGDLSNDKIRGLLENKEMMNDFKNRAISRGLTIGVIDGLTGGLATAVTRKAAMTVGSKLLATTAGIATEAIGGSLGEMAGMVMAGQEFDTKEILFEGVAGTATAPITVGVGLLKAPKYELNGGIVSGKDMAKFISTATDKQIAEANITIKNDKTMLNISKEKRNKAIDRHNIEKDIDPDIKGEARERLIELELERISLVNKNTRSAKNKLTKIESEIDDISEGKPVRKEKTDIETFFEEKEGKPKKEVVKGVKRDNTLTDEEIAQGLGIIERGVRYRFVKDIKNIENMSKEERVIVKKIP